jgi:heat shock protein HtpX
MALGAVGLRTWQWNNGLKSLLLLAGFPVLLYLLAFAIVLLFGAGDADSVADGLRDAWRATPGLFAGACVVALVWFAIAARANRWIVDRITGAHEVTRKDEPRLWNLLENLCISRGLPMPRLGIIDTEARNAFASGLFPQQYAVTVTRGLLDTLDDAELEAVLAHELTHIRNRDVRLMVIAGVVVGIISLVGELLMRGRWFVWRGGGRSRGNKGSAGALVLIAIAIMALVYGLAFVLRLAVSRNREFLADAGAAELTRNPDAMIGALRKIAGHSDIAGVPGQVRAMFLDDAQASGWWGTHPPLQARIDALVRHAGGRDPGPLPEPAAPSPAPTGTAANPWRTPEPRAAPGETKPGQASGTNLPWWRQR